MQQVLAWSATSPLADRHRRRGGGDRRALQSEVTRHPVTGSAQDRAGWLEDHALLACVGAGDDRARAALAELYRRHGTSCYRLARRVTASDVLAEDVVQEAFLALWRQPGGYRRGLGSVRGWLLSLTHHKAVDVVRREDSQRRRQDAHAAQFALDPPAGTDPAVAAWDGIRAARVRQALAELPEAQRHVLALAYFGGCTQREIAELTGLPLGTVKTRMFTAMRRLASRLSAVAEPSGEPL
jgi:RNA polymerase sigma factor (sigma-70 family)